MSPPHPGEFIRDEILEELKLTVTDAANVLGVRQEALSDLIHGKTPLSPEMALRIEKAFAVNMEMLLRIQTWHDAKTMRERASEINVKPYKPTEPGKSDRAKAAAMNEQLEASIDAAAARQRLAEIDLNPEKLIQGKALQARLSRIKT